LEGNVLHLIEKRYRRDPLVENKGTKKLAVIIGNLYEKENNEFANSIFRKEIK